MIDFQSKGSRRVAAVIFLLAIMPSLWFSARTYGSLLLLRSAYEVGSPSVSSVRGWMTLGYVSATYNVPADALIARLKLPPATSVNTTLRTLAERAGADRFEYVQRVQRAIAEVGPGAATAGGEKPPNSWFGLDTNAILSAILVYGYPALAAILFLGALGAPVPTGLATTLAGSLAGRGDLDWLTVATIAVIASAIGDVLGYGIGRWLGEGFLDRRGKWFGFSPSRRERVRMLFERWGGITVLLTRTLVSHLSSVVSLLAGLMRYRFAAFLLLAVIGRAIWTSAYLGLGYGAGTDIEAASTFLANLTGLLLSLAVLIVSGVIASGRAPQRSRNI